MILWLHPRPATFISASLLALRPAPIPPLGIIETLRILWLCRFGFWSFGCSIFFRLGWVLVRIKRKILFRWTVVSLRYSRIPTLEFIHWQFAKRPPILSDHGKARRQGWNRSRKRLHYPGRSHDTEYDWDSQALRMQICILKSAKVIVLHHFFGTMPTVHLQPK